jgi:hypothetical protein
MRRFLPWLRRRRREGGWEGGKEGYTASRVDRGMAPRNDVPGEREGGKEGGREGVREGGRDGGKEGRREGGREGGRVRL